MKVDQQHRAAAPHHPVRRHRRVDAARQQARDAAAGAGRQPAGARLLAEEVERVGPAASRCGSSAPDASRSTCQPRRLLDQPADLALDLRRRERQPLVGARRARRGTTPASRSPRSSRIAAASASKSCGPRPACEKFAMPNTRPQPLAHLVPAARSRPSSISIRPIDRPHRRHVEARQRRRRLRTSIWTNHGRFRPFSASSL